MDVRHSGVTTLSLAQSARALAMLKTRLLIFRDSEKGDVCHFHRGRLHGY